MNDGVRQTQKVLNANLLQDQALQGHSAPSGAIAAL
jgi:hypothetical protein